MTTPHRRRRVGRTVRCVVPFAVVLLVGAGVWLAFTGSRALAAVGDLQDAATRANSALDGPLWSALADVPYLGDTPQVARTTATALAAAADGLTPWAPTRSQ